MGQAKRKGSFEDRVAAAQERERLAELAREESERIAEAERQAKWDAMTDEEKEAALRKQRKAKSSANLLSSLYGMALASALGNRSDVDRLMKVSNALRRD